MSKIVAIEENNKATVIVEGDKVDSLTNLAIICKSMLENGFSQKELQYAIDLAAKENEKSKKDIEEELDKEILKIIAEIIK